MLWSYWKEIWENSDVTHKVTHTHTNPHTHIHTNTLIKTYNIHSTHKHIHNTHNSHKYSNSHTQHTQTCTHIVQCHLLNLVFFEVSYGKTMAISNEARRNLSCCPPLTNSFITQHVNLKFPPINTEYSFYQHIINLIPFELDFLCRSIGTLWALITQPLLQSLVEGYSGSLPPLLFLKCSFTIYVSWPIREVTSLKYNNTSLFINGDNLLKVSLLI